jgi:hypothetical protein
MTVRLSARAAAPLGAAALATLLAACGGHTVGAIPTGNDAGERVSHGQTFSHSQTFKFTGKPQRFKVPHVRWLQVVLLGAGGGASAGSGARGARVYALIPAALDRTLVVYVGGAGKIANGGFNGGAAGGVDTFRSGVDGYGGGGASDIRLAAGTLGDRVIVAAGAGGDGGGSGTGKDAGGAGGSGGDRTGGNGSNGSGGTGYGCVGKGGDGGSLTAGGAGGSGADCETAEGYPGDDGSIGSGGAGGDGYGAGGGGGGGGGFYGGGGGGGGAGSLSYGAGGAGGGGGGPSFVGKRATHARVWPGWKTAVGNGLVVISW